MKLKIILSKTLLIALLLCLSGCIGVQTIYNKKFESRILPEWNVDGRYIGTKFINKEHLYTKQEVVDLIGKPRREWSENGYEYLAYHNKNNGWKWYGTIVHIILPVPLVIPVGLEESVLRFKDNNLQSVIVENTETGFYGCIMLNLIHRNEDGSYNDKSIHDICATIF